MLAFHSACHCRDPLHLVAYAVMPAGSRLHLHENHERLFVEQRDPNQDRFQIWLFPPETVVADSIRGHVIHRPDLGHWLAVLDAAIEHDRSLPPGDPLRGESDAIADVLGWAINAARLTFPPRPTTASFMKAAPYLDGRVLMTPMGCPQDRPSFLELRAWWLVERERIVDDEERFLAAERDNPGTNP